MAVVVLVNVSDIAPDPPPPEGEKGMIPSIGTRVQAYVLPDKLNVGVKL